MLDYILSILIIIIIMRKYMVMSSVLAHSS